MVGPSPVKRILVVDDEECTREALAEVLREESYEVAVAADGQSAIEQIERFAPHLVLTDLDMPGIDGAGVIRFLRQANLAIPAIVYSSHATADEGKTAEKLGAVRYLNKPLDVGVVLASIARALEP
jgi:CheY-like chemotaxis protein